jgi:tyrosinase
LSSVKTFWESTTGLIATATEFGADGGPVWGDLPSLEVTFRDECDRSCKGIVGNPDPTPITGVSCVRVRKEVSDLTTNELTRFNQAFLTAYDPAFNETNDEGQTELQVLIQSYTNFFSRGLHNNGAFLPWHRGYILELENLLRKQDCRVTVPYWNWSKNPEISKWAHWGNSEQQFSGDGDSTECVQDGPFGFESGFQLTSGSCLQRRITGGSAATAATIQSDLFDAFPSPSNYDAFRNRLEHGPGMHDSIHCLVGGTMCSARASNDPIFFTLHAYIDFIWARWQAQSSEHRNAYSGDTARNSQMPASDWTPEDLLDLNNQPGGVAVRYK